MKKFNLSDKIMLQAHKEEIKYAFIDMEHVKEFIRMINEDVLDDVDLYSHISKKAVVKIIDKLAGKQLKNHSPQEAKSNKNQSGSSPEDTPDVSMDEETRLEASGTSDKKLKLKTLKDFFPCELQCKYDHNILISELKQEAIKWINDSEFYDKFDHNKSYWRWVFINFFNISDEELTSAEEEATEEDLEDA